MNKLIYSALAGIALLTSLGARAEDDALRPVCTSWMFGAGSSHIVDTYLTPLHYDGWNMTLNYQRLQAMKFNPERWTQQINIGLEVDRTNNPAHNARLWYAGLHGSWGMMWRNQLPLGINSAIGGQVRGDAGVVYSDRNGNNPASVKADVTVGLQGMLSRRFKVGRMPVTVLWQSELPVVGAFFSPEYDELYYEIYLGNHKSLGHCAWWGNFLRWDNLVAADLDISNTRLRVGFQSGLLSTRVNNITSRIYNFSFVVGVTTDWFSINRRRSQLPETQKIIYAL